MNGKDLWRGLGYVDGAYVREAEAVPAARRPRWGAMAAAAAALALVLAAGALLPGLRGAPADGGESPDSGAVAPPPADSGTPPVDSGTLPETGAKAISLADVACNELAGQMDTARRWLDPAEYDQVVWTMEDVAAYYGRDPFPAYVPEGLSGGAADGDARWTVYAAKDGTLAEDAVGRRYAAAFQEDGGAVSGALGGKTLDVRCSRLGLMTDCVYLLPENEVEVTDILGAAVTFGCRRMGQGPYDPVTHEPAGYFDLYTAAFSLDGTEYEIVTEGLPAEEIVKVAASIVSGGAAVDVQ